MYVLGCWLESWSLIEGKKNIFFSPRHPDQFGGTPNSLCNRMGTTSLVEKLAIFYHVVSILRMLKLQFRFPICVNGVKLNYIIKCKMTPRLQTLYVSARDGMEFRGTRGQDSLCWRGPAAIQEQQNIRQHEYIRDEITTQQRLSLRIKNVPCSHGRGASISKRLNVQETSTVTVIDCDETWSQE
jgi:hypothetical protein